LLPLRTQSTTDCSSDSFGVSSKSHLLSRWGSAGHRHQGRPESKWRSRSFLFVRVKCKAIRSSVSGIVGKTRRQKQRQGKLSLLTVNVNQNQRHARLNSSTELTNGQQTCLPLLQIECGLMRIKRKTGPRFLAARDSSLFFAFLKQRGITQVFLKGIQYYVSIENLLDARRLAPGCKLKSSRLPRLISFQRVCGREVLFERER
jgi:hypothetical protein